MTVVGRIADRLRRPGLRSGARGAVFLLATGWVAGQSGLDEAQLGRFQAAEAAFAEQRYGEAAAGYETLAGELPEYAELHAKLGLSRFFNRQCSQSAPAFQKALDIRPDLKAARVLLSICLSELGRFSEALPGLEAGYADPPDYPGVKRLAGLELVRSYLGLGRHARAAKITAELQIAHPEDPEILFHANRTYREVAIQAAFEIARVAPESVWGHQAMGEAYEGRQYYDLAIMEYRKALALDPDRPGLRFRLGEAMLAKAGAPAQASDALEEFQRELAANPNHASAALRVGEIHQAQDRAEAALDYYRTAVRLRPDYQEAHLALGKLLLELDDAAGAAEHLQAAVRLNPDDASGHYQLARAFGASGDAEGRQRALAEYRRLQSRRRQLDKAIFRGEPPVRPLPEPPENGSPESQ